MTSKFHGHEQEFRACTDSIIGSMLVFGYKGNMPYFIVANEVLGQNDPKFKKYTVAIEKCLTSFDNVHEWADFIAFLTRLLKVRDSSSIRA